MTAAYPLLRDLDALRNTRKIGGLFAGSASGLMVAAAVLLFFVRCGLDREASILLVVPVGLAFVCTTVSSILAIRAPSTSKAVLWTFAGNVLPPTLLCLPTIMGVLYATPAGLVAFVFTLPVVLAARGARSEPNGPDSRPDHARERLVGALTLCVVTLALLAFNALSDRYEQLVWDSAPSVLPASLIPIVTALGAAALALMTAVPELRRARLADRIGRGQVAGLASRVEVGVTHVDEVAMLGGGPMRSAVSRQAVGGMVWSPARAVVGALLSVVGVHLLALSALAAVL
ncbi:MAG: hypothetical protein AB8I08_17720 [Sandaracinaceae bacterium]